MSFPSAFAQPPHGQPAAVSAPPVTASLPVPVRAGRSTPIWLWAILFVLLCGVIAYLVTFLGTTASVIAAILAMLPLAGVLFAVHLVDRWEPEPRGLLIAAFAWGAVGAVGLTLLIDLAIAPARSVLGYDLSELFATVIQAPVIEELTKGLGVLLIYVIGRRAFDGPVDGVVYGALVGAGFAFTENIQYFAVSLLTGGVGETTFTFILRGILSPFAHVMFTAVTGFLLGLAARRGATMAGTLGMWVVGLAGAAALHALWNGSTVFGDFFALYLTLQVPLFIAFVIGIVLLRREEARLTRERLTDYADAGWFTPGEIEMLATPRGRRHAVTWARGLPGDRSALMRSFIRDATALASTRQRAITGRDPQAADDERVYLTRAVATRSALLAR